MPRLKRIIKLCIYENLSFLKYASGMSNKKNSQLYWMVGVLITLTAIMAIAVPIASDYMLEKTHGEAGNQPAQAGQDQGQMPPPPPAPSPPPAPAPPPAQGAVSTTFGEPQNFGEPINNAQPITFGEQGENSSTATGELSSGAPPPPPSASVSSATSDPNGSNGTSPPERYVKIPELR